MTLEGDGVTGTEKRGREGTETLQTLGTPWGAPTPAVERRCRANRSRRPRRVYRREKKEGERGGEQQVGTQRHSDGADGARPKHSALARHEYGLLVPEEPAGDPAVARPQRSRENPKYTMGT